MGDENDVVNNKYINSVIYKWRHIEDLNDDMILIGSTYHFSKRKYKYKQDICNPNSKDYNTPSCVYIRENGGYNNWIMEVIEKYPCNNKDELRMKEDELILKMNPKLNTYRAYVTHEEFQDIKKEYYFKNKDEIIKRNAEYYNKNKDNISKKCAEYYKQNKNKIDKKALEYYKQNRDEINKKQAEYRKQNRDEINKKKAEYYKQNRDEINKKLTEYRKQNRDEINKRKAEYYNKNKDKIKEKQRERYRLKKLEKQNAVNN